ncbi:MAG: hypothetical protein SFY32_14025 [Bacteroidota bacterium]|nr:hypothetical protein [Bacteroidota bacterium]
MLPNIPKSTKILTLIAILSVALAFYSVQRSKINSTFEQTGEKFPKTDSASVSSISITNNQRSKFELQLKNRIWYLNDAIADQNRVGRLIGGLPKIKIVREVFKEKQTKAIGRLKEKGFTISIKGDQSDAESLIIYPDSSNPFTAIALIGTQTVPMVIEMPGAEFPFTYYFSPNPLFFKDKTLFSRTLGDISSITVIYTEQPQDNFTISKMNNVFKVNEVPDADTLKLRSYIDLFNNVSIKEYLDAKFDFKKDSLLKMKPTFKVSVKYSNEDNSNEIWIYYNPKIKGDIFGIITKHNELVTIRPIVFEYILQKKDFFKQKIIK